MHSSYIIITINYKNLISLLHQIESGHTRWILYSILCIYIVIIFVTVLAVSNVHAQKYTTKNITSFPGHSQLFNQCCMLGMGLGTRLIRMLMHAVSKLVRIKG